MQAIRRAHPDYESAQVYAILSLNETLQNIATQLISGPTECMNR
jgi:hypothetical protein